MNNPNLQKYANGFDKNPQNINRKGRPRKTFRTFNDRCKAEGVPVITKEEYMTTLNYLLSMTEEELKEITKDPEQSMFLRWIITDLKNVSLRCKMIQDVRDWLFGKSQENLKVEGTIKTDINISIDGIDIDEIKEEDED